ncbi:unnamed protein product [Lymnaea stagnalis]|uniref:Ig-like domain-containing protein n=1 Tax=Lymnaea stagnalis TaxID=6523 RepID=A0AAV2GYV9_LYMST
MVEHVKHFLNLAIFLIFGKEFLMKMINTVRLGILLFIASMYPSKCELRANFTTITRCDPALENKPYNLTFIWKTNNTKVRVNVESHDSTIGFCEMRTVRCVSILPGLAKIYLTNISDMYNLTVTIKNMSRDPGFTYEGCWTLRYNSSLKEFLSCTMKVYSMPLKMTCESYTVNGAVKLNCSTQMIYPEAKCQLLTNDIEMNKVISKLPVSYKHIIVTGRVHYYQSSCEVSLPLSSFRNETYKVSVTMYPNGSDTDRHFGTTITSEIELGHPIVNLTDCPPIIEVGTSVTCTCAHSNFSVRNDLIVWLDENQQPILPTSNIVHFNVSQNAISYYCVVKNVSGSIISKVLYRPNIIVRPYNLTCHKGPLADDKVIISCTALGVYPDPKCKFIAYDNTGEIQLQNETAASQNKLQLGKVIQYKCALDISKLVMQQDLRVVVIMYPYITGIETEVFILGENVTVLQDRCEPVCLKEELLKLLCIVIGTISPIILISLVVLFVLNKKGILRKVWKRIQDKSNGEHQEETASKKKDMEMTEKRPLNERNDDKEVV